MKKNVNETEKLMKTATIASVFVAGIIISIKLIAWVMTDSLSLLSSLLDSVLDMVSSFIGLMAVRYSLQPADEDHRFGHGKAEDIAAFAQSAFIAGSGVFIIIEAISRFITPSPVTNSMIGILVMVASSVLTFALITFQRNVIKKTKSTAIQADCLHYSTDLLVNMLVIVSFFAVMFWDVAFIDPALALIIAIYIFKSAWQVGRGAFDKLMDKEFSGDDRQKIMDTVLACESVKGIHDLRTRSSGIKPFIQFHLELDGTIMLKDAHRISDSIESEILKLFPNAEVLIHQDIEGENVPIELGQAVPVKKK
ncbi:MAG: fieF [Rickettsiaceae bacterium]|jgi:ferrous-iron efflux pump FieF|nr:fieF [Rickettsiaceae bacterium]